MWEKPLLKGGLAIWQPARGKGSEHLSCYSHNTSPLSIVLSHTVTIIILIIRGYLGSVGGLGSRASEPTLLQPKQLPSLLFFLSGCPELSFEERVQFEYPGMTGMADPQPHPHHLWLICRTPGLAGLKGQSLWLRLEARALKSGYLAFES